MEKSKAENEANRLLNEAKRDRSNSDYSNWPLREVPFEVIWNEFARSSKLPVIY